MKRLKTFLPVVLLTLLLQLVADHIMRSMLEKVSYLFIGTLAGSCGLLALLIVKLIKWAHP